MVPNRKTDDNKPSRCTSLHLLIRYKSLGLVVLLSYLCRQRLSRRHLTLRVQILQEQCSERLVSSPGYNVVQRTGGPWHVCTSFYDGAQREPSPFYTLSSKYLVPAYEGIQSAVQSTTPHAWRGMRGYAPRISVRMSFELISVASLA